MQMIFGLQTSIFVNSRKLEKNSWQIYSDNFFKDWMVPKKEIDEFEKDYLKKMIKAKDDYDEMKEREGDSDLIFNKKDNKKNKET